MKNRILSLFELMALRNIPLVTILRSLSIAFLSFEILGEKPHLITEILIILTIVYMSIVYHISGKIMKYDYPLQVSDSLALNLLLLVLILFYLGNSTGIGRVIVIITFTYSIAKIRDRSMYAKFLFFRSESGLDIEKRIFLLTKSIRYAYETNFKDYDYHYAMLRLADLYEMVQLDNVSEYLNKIKDDVINTDKNFLKIFCFSGYDYANFLNVIRDDLKTFDPETLCKKHHFF